MRELSFDEFSQVAGGQQSSDGDQYVMVYGTCDGRGDASPPPAGGTGVVDGSQLPLLSMVVPAAAVLQQFFDDFSNAEHTGQPDTGSDYDHDIGADTPYSFTGGIPTHDPTANLPYWSTWGLDTDPEFLQHILEESTTTSTGGVFAVQGAAGSSGVALDFTDPSHPSAYVSGLYFTGTYHLDSPPANSGSGSNGNDIIVYGHSLYSGYWTFSASNYVPQVTFPDINFGTIGSPGYVSNAGGYNGTTGYPSSWSDPHDHAIDVVAKSLADKINAMLDNSIREYSAYIWEDTQGNIHESAILPGNFGDAGATNGTSGMNPFSAYGIPPGAILVGLIHNHPENYTFLDKVTGAISSRVDNPYAQFTDSGDMNTMTSIVNTYSVPGNTYSVDKFGGVDYFRNYVMYKGTVSEYDYIQHQTGIIPGANVALPGAVKGNYNP